MKGRYLGQCESPHSFVLYRGVAGLICTIRVDLGLSQSGLHRGVSSHQEWP